MSASLVGSEMCIRDRSWQVLQMLGMRRKLIMAMACCTSLRPRRAAKGTVSYTHLTLPTICSV
eukprot:6339150-Alexandrium_andersonii.AAC.1